MTLKSVAARIRAFPWSSSSKQIAAEWVAQQFESDPEFTAPERLKEAERQLAEAREETKDLRARIEKLARELEGSYQEDRIIARRLRECLGEKALNP